VTDTDREAGPSALPWLPLLPWQETTAREALAQKQRWPHALLIHGPRGLGKHALALNFAQALLCESPLPDGMACGRCPGCRYASAGQHPDLMRLELAQFDAEEAEFKAVDGITIDRVRTLIEFVQLTSHRQRAKVAVIAPAERMNTAAANALLKTLEEPPTGTYLILVSSEPGRLPPTIVSRCRKLPAPLPTFAAAQAWLVAQGVADPALALAQAGGAPLVALSRSDSAVVAERRAWLAGLSEPERLTSLELAARIDAGGKNERKARLAHAVEWLLAWTADLARLQAGDQARLNPDAATALARLAPQVAPVPLFRYHRFLLMQRALLAHPLSPRLVAEAMLIDYAALFD
jgi:DNA polymerase-3 subunit delta'